jgi:dolichol-phosphate mannosyltransferase
MERKVSIILPTLNEEQNVYKIVQEIKLKLKQKFEIIFVDDDSNDGTQERIEELKTKYDNIKSIFRKEKNLSTAFLDGLKIASGEYIVLMDSDLQHDPINIEKALSIIYEKKIDMIIGSRFLSDSKNYTKSYKSRFRLGLSKLFIFIFNQIFRTNLSDPLSGFFAAKRKILLNKDHLLFKKGFKIVLDFYLLLRNKVLISEIPISLNKRNSGNSKISFKILVLIIQQVIFYLRK